MHGRISSNLTGNGIVGLWTNILDSIIQYGTDIFGSASVITIVPTFLNITDVIVDIHTLWTNCSLPPPFYGSYCSALGWYSSGDLAISLADAITSVTPAHHDGTFQVSEVSLLVSNSSFTTGVDLVINNLSTLSVNSSALLVQQTLYISNSTLQVSTLGNTIISKQVILNEAFLSINITQNDLAQLYNANQISVVVFHFSQETNITGTFNNISLGSIVEQANLSCPLKLSQQIEDNLYKVFIAFDCPVYLAINWQMTTAVTIVCCLVLALSISAYVSYRIYQTREQNLAKFEINLAHGTRIY